MNRSLTRVASLLPAFERVDCFVLKLDFVSITTEFNTQLDRLRIQLPDEEDLTGSVQAILRLQDMYDIPAKEIAEGSIGGLNTGELNADACFELGRIAYEDGDYYHGFHWMAIAKERLDKETNKTTDMTEILDYMAWTAHELGNDKLALELTEELIELELDEYARQNDENAKTRMKHLADLKNKAKSNDIEEGDTVLIRNEVKKNKLTPIFDPRPQTVIKKKDNSILTMINAWLDDRDHLVVDRVQNRIKAVTGLDLDSADALQVANYGIGGHYDPHYDFSIRDDDDTSETEKRDGNRIATFLLYMTDVDAGGATVFPIIDVRVLPKKGTAVFWYNLRRSGKGIMETRHAACPVLVGTKWVSNKWIRTRGQEFRRPCGLTEDE
ncbi:P4HA [Mytilus edulis]|uniref:procollagen-proline 4-dioxygenase n=1 Tax=Mytilus edulis TaxID=6550 RepID=A0A8S3QPS1_MYTED|nr:P4HA [Mytilus edulis]